MFFQESGQDLQKKRERFVPGRGSHRRRSMSLSHSFASQGQVWLGSALTAWPSPRSSVNRCLQLTWDGGTEATGEMQQMHSVPCEGQKTQGRTPERCSILSLICLFKKFNQKFITGISVRFQLYLMVGVFVPLCFPHWQQCCKQEVKLGNLSILAISEKQVMLKLQSFSLSSWYCSETSL